jgi:hypothetical protein
VSVVLHVEEESIHGGMIGKTVEYLWIVYDIDPFNKTLKDILIVNILDLPSNWRILVEFEEDVVLLLE